MFLQTTFHLSSKKLVFTFLSSQGMFTVNVYLTTSDATFCSKGQEKLCSDELFKFSI